MAKPKTIEETLSSSNLLIENILNNQEILSALSVFGYDETKLNEGKALYQTALDLYNEQKREYGEQYAATDAFRAAFEEAYEKYIYYVKIARLVFKNNKGVWQELGLTGKRKDNFSGWLLQANQFYNNALANPEILNKFATVNVTQESLTAGKALVDAAEQANQTQEKEKGEAQNATKTRDAALDDLEVWIEDLKGFSRIALEGKPQLLESLGLGVI
jgi:hypothetical protein